MKKKLLILIAGASFSLTGCSTKDTKSYVKNFIGKIGVYFKNMTLKSKYTKETNEFKEIEETDVLLKLEKMSNMKYEIEDLPKISIREKYTVENRGFATEDTYLTQDSVQECSAPLKFLHEYYKIKTNNGTSEGNGYTYSFLNTTFIVENTVKQGETLKVFTEEKGETASFNDAHSALLNMARNESCFNIVKDLLDDNYKHGEMIPLHRSQAKYMSYSDTSLKVSFVAKGVGRTSIVIAPYDIEANYVDENTYVWRNGLLESWSCSTTETLIDDKGNLMTRITTIKGDISYDFKLSFPKLTEYEKDTQ